MLIHGIVLQMLVFIFRNFGRLILKSCVVTVLLEYFDRLFYSF